MNRFLIVTTAAVIAFAGLSCGRLPEQASGPATSGSENPFGSSETDDPVDIAGVVVTSDDTVVNPSEAPSAPEATTPSIDSGPAAADTGPTEDASPSEEAPTEPSAPPITPKPVPKDDPVVPGGDQTDNANSGGTHTVALGETLSTIAQKYSVSTRAIKDFNGLSDADVIREGQKLKIPG